MNTFEKRIGDHSNPILCSLGLETLQVNVGLRCNQQCKHCHLECSPSRKEVMDWSTMTLILEAAGKSQCRLVDITGGAPEINPHFRRFVKALRSSGYAVQVRTNLTVLLEPDLEDTPELVNEDPYGQGWFVRIRPDDVAGLDGLLDADAYKTRIKAQG